MANCVLNYGHTKTGELCIYSKKENEHLCAEKCFLCQEYCCFPYNHKEEYHLCNNKHIYKEDCEQNGFCEIEGIYIQERKIYHLKNNTEEIEYFPGGEQEKKETMYSDHSSWVTFS